MKIGMVIAHEGFRDEEYFLPLETFRTHGMEVVTISSDIRPARGKYGGEAAVDVLIEAVDVSLFDGLVFIGGPGTREYLDNPIAHNLAREAVSQQKLVGAICMAPVILARAGLLSGKKATAFPGNVRDITDKGAHYVPASVVEDGRIVTANGPESAGEFAVAVIKQLQTS